jgi:hypothetical protein
MSVANPGIQAVQEAMANEKEHATTTDRTFRLAIISP